MNYPTMRTSLMLAALALISVNTLHAQGRDRGLVDVGSSGNDRSWGGFYGSLGLGGGAERYRFSDEPDFTESLTKPTISLRLGGTPSDQLRLGGEVFAWGNEATEGLQSFSTVMMTGQFYIGSGHNFHLRGGLGFARSGTEFNDGGSAFETGFGTAFGAGFDIPLSRTVAITPAIDIYQGRFTRRDEPTLTERVVNIGVAVTFQGGRRR